MNTNAPSNGQGNDNSSYGGPRSTNRPGPDLRANPNMATTFLGPGQPAKESNSTRAARYEDEKKRIIDSCFSRKEPDGLLQESYITHVRITEDAMYPSEPPPPDSAPNNKKNRLVLVAVRKSGRVRVHKARENPTGTFSIGKTWNLDELSAIQIYAGVAPTNDKEAMQKQWAGENGFTVTLGKAYYWYAPTSKEKDFFIASLIKIYKKYTGGKLPELTGFSPHQLDALAGPQQSRTPSANLAQTPQNQSASPPSMQGALSQGPLSQMNRYSPAPRNRFEQQAPPPRADLRSAARDGPGSSMPEPLKSPTRADKRIVSRDGARLPSDASAIGQARGDPPANMPPAPRQQPPLQGPQLPPQASLDQQKTELSPEVREKLGFAPSSRPSNGESQLSRPSAPSVASQDSSSEYGASTMSLRERSLSAVRSNDRPSVSSPADRIPPVASPPPVPTQHAAVIQPDQPPPPDRKRPFIPRPEANGTKTNGVESQFVTPATTPSAVTEDKPPQLPGQDAKNEDSAQTAGKADYFNAVTMPHAAATSEQSQRDVAEPSSIPKEEAASTPGEVTTPSSAEEHRPGLGPMLKKKNVADTFRKAALAATAANAFRPRQGGGAARLKAMQEENKRGTEPDGITGVVPAPLLRGVSNDSVASNRPGTPGTPGLKEQPPTPGPAAPPTPAPQQAPAAPPPRVEIERTATQDSFASIDSKRSGQSVKDHTLLDSNRNDDPVPEAVQEPVRPPTPEKARSRSPLRRKRQRQEADLAKYSSSLGIDIRVFEGRGADFNDLLTEFGWKGRLDPKRKVEELEAEVRREIGRAQASGWLGHVEQQDTKVLDLAKAFDRAIEECEELDGLFTLYSHELDTLAADIEYIEAQSQGLQVQTANQKLLQKELQGLLSTLEISNADLQDLHYSSLDHAEGLAFVERALTTLYRALITIDPNVRQNRQRREGQGSNAERGVGVYADAELGQMRAVKEKKNEYAEQSQAFVQRFCQHMTTYFKKLDQGRDDVSLRSIASDSSSSLSSQRSVRQEMWIYNATLLFIREVNSYEWKTLIKSYEMNIQGSYQERFRQSTMAARREARKPAGDEHEALFTFQEKEKPEDSLTSSAARKLTVKRNKPPKPSGPKHSNSSGLKIADGKPHAWDVFQSTIQRQAKAVAEEQNFVVSFFHLSSQSNADFTELVSSRPPAERRLPNLDVKMPFEPDKNISLTVEDTVSAIFSFWLADLQSNVDWVIKQDVLQGIGVLFALEHLSTMYDETNQEFITKTLRTLHDRLKGMFTKFVEEQIKAIEDTKVKLKKRKGIISFMRTFPVFTAAVENMAPAEMVDNETLEVRFILNEAYRKISRAMWESLSFIAKDDGTTTQGPSTAPAGGDPEDKEALNYHILLIENMNHYLEEVDTHQNVVLEEWRNRAENDMFTHLAQYTDAVIRRPLGKWLDFVESTEALMKTHDKLSAISSKPSHSRSACKKIIKTYDAGEIRKGVETLKRRIEKHFGDVDDPSHMSKSLIARVYDECNARYAHAHDRMNIIIVRIYENNLEIDWKKEDVNAMFRR